jgi:CDP-6-deoxy-D-xylo-4-hexulose-3-dehydrase
MVCTKNKRYLEILKSLRSHGWSRDLKNNKILSKKYKNIDKNWIFINSGFNLRTTDINASIGLEQLKRIKKILLIRKYNFLKIKKSLLENKKYNNQFTILDDQKNTNAAWFGIPIILNSNKKRYKQRIMSRLHNKGIMTRPIISGNFAKQPSINLYKIKINYKLPKSDLIDKKAFFIGLHNLKITNSKLKFLTDSIYSSL